MGDPRFADGSSQTHWVAEPPAGVTSRVVNTVLRVDDREGRRQGRRMPQVDVASPATPSGSYGLRRGPPLAASP